jgi:methylmalonyl-CoA mutase (EC 5.4.99.2)
MAAVAGGTQSLHTNSRDEALALPTEESAKIALRTQQIVAHESGITKTADPLAGSYYLEELCDQIEADVWKYLKKIERMGGSVKAIEKGFFQSEIRANAYRLKKKLITKIELSLVSINILKRKNNLNYLELMVELKFNKRKHLKNYVPIEILKN